MALPCKNTRNFFLNGTPTQFEHVLGLYDQCLRLKAESKSQKPENVIRLDKWYQNELPKRIKSRGKDAHLTHEDLVQTIKWKLARGKFRPNLTNLVQMNTPRVVTQETKKAFRNLFKRNDLQAANKALCALKGVGPAMASAVLAAGAPHMAPFMADECLLALPDIECLDYTMSEYMRYVDHVNDCVKRLNEDEGSDKWTPHKVELTVWSYYIANDLKPELLANVPSANGSGNENEQSENKAENGSQKETKDNADNADNADNDKEADNKKESEKNKEPNNHTASTNGASTITTNSSESGSESTENSNQSAPDSADSADNSSNDAVENVEKEKVENKAEAETNGNSSNENKSSVNSENSENSDSGKKNSSDTTANGVSKDAEIPAAVAAEAKTETPSKRSLETSEAEEPAQKKLKPEEPISMASSA